MANTAPSTPETPRRLAVNRSFTLPSKLATTSRAGTTAEIGAMEGVETLYVHPNANIIKFTTPSSRPASSGSPRTPRDLGSGALPWVSPTERTLAAGPLEIYRVPGSVSFLRSGALLHAILPRSLCWCVDGISKFALRVLPDTYYRIELPAHTPEDHAKVEEIKEVLSKVLFYERIACPFNRGIQEELPTVEELDGRKKTRRRSHGPAKKWKLDRAYSWKPEDGKEPERRASEVSNEADDSSELGSEEEECEPEQQAEQQVEAGAALQSVATPSRPSTLPTLRSATAPPPLTVRTPVRMRASIFVDGTVEVSSAASIPAPKLDPGRLRTFQPILTDMPPSPPDSSAGLESIEVAGPSSLHSPLVDPVPDSLHDVRVEEAGATAAAYFSESQTSEALPGPEGAQSSDREAADAEYTGRWTEEEPQHAEATPTESYELPKIVRQRSSDDPFAAIQARILARRSIGGTTSFHPPLSTTSSTSSTSSTSTLASRRSYATLPQQQNMASALVKKACAVFLGPPAHLVAIMLRIAARFTSGALGFGSWFVVESPRGHKRVPGSFNLESIDADDLEGDNELEEWEEDDFGVPLRSPVRLAKMHSALDAVTGAQERKRWVDD
ncbi:hypothetical protein BAUCODRAFT_499032 [Baudoinia panamericana UAMH 10762]|uniref:Inheritance of peroxisomes protein 1 n=1 Tax=Baudoinia panamericana (strain UAMH 10762) TaxID=717646 RepID=M2LMX4_BAUPA|nr:uncharacterized protein BAUCODRAFT_499032 [Baudoinia panamericana UAMH 10762]EMC95687.1 hypothetical protein BAUCODRAFT_499032 [Baudoinia panamericana UAMH 10762]